MIYHSVFDASVAQLSSRLKDIGAVVPQWQYTMYRQTHFHSTTHEILGIISGRARLFFGGEQNPGRVEPVVEKGDLIIVPAGVAHRLLEDQTGMFQMLGSYPPGKTWDMCYGFGKEDEGQVRRNIEHKSGLIGIRCTATMARHCMSERSNEKKKEVHSMHKKEIK